MTSTESVRATPECQVDLERAIVRANLAQIGAAIGAGADVECVSVSDELRRGACPNNDEPLTLIGRIMLSGLEVTRQFKFDGGAVASRGQTGTRSVDSLARREPSLETMDVRWNRVKQALLTEAVRGKWARLPLAYQAAEFAALRATCVGLFGSAKAPAEDANTLVDLFVRSCAGGSEETASTTTRIGASSAEMVERLQLLLDRMDRGAAAVQVEQAAARCLLSGTADIARRGASSPYFIGFCVIVEWLDGISPALFNRIGQVRRKVGKEDAPLLELALGPIVGVDHKWILERMLAAGFDPNEARSATQRTVLMSAVRSAAFEEVAALLAAGADVKKKDNRGRTARGYGQKSNVVAGVDEAAQMRNLLVAGAAKSAMDRVLGKVKIASKQGPHG